MNKEKKWFEIFKKKPRARAEHVDAHKDHAPVRYKKERPVPFKGLREKMGDAFSGGFSLKAQTSFAKRLAFLMDAGVPVVEALHMLKEQAKIKSHISVLSVVVEDTASGQALSKSFGKFPKFFNDFAVSIIRVGESSGTLSQSLIFLADELKKRQALRQKVAGALVYPAVLTVATVGITAFLMMYLFPKIMPIFSSLHTELPLTTKIVIAISTFLQLWGLWLLVGIIAFFFLVGFLIKKFKSIRYFRDDMLVRMPFLGIMFRSFYVANISRTLGLLLKSGMRLSEALPVTAETTGNLVYKKLLNELGEGVLRGERISANVAKHSAYFPDMFAHLVAVGERSGSLSETLVYLSEMYDTEVDDFTKNLSTLIEPALMIVMGVIVGFIAISIITPIYGITQSLQN